MRIQKKTAVYLLVVFLVIVVLIVLGARLWFSPKPETVSQHAQFGDHALKINGKWVSQKAFQEEEDSFFERYSRNGVMLRKSDEERNDLMLDEIIDQQVTDEFLLHQAKVTVTPQEVDSYIKRYILTEYSTPALLQQYLNDAGYQNAADLRRKIRNLFNED